jgi:DNA modification methylase
VLPELTPDKLRSIVIKDNVAFGSDDFDMLANDWDIVELVEWGMEIPSLDIESEQEEEQDSKDKPKKLSDRFIIPPFSILDTKQGAWQQRKNYWLSLGIKSELGRNAESLTLNGATAKKYDYLPNIESGTSIFDPVLCELAYQWFCPPKGKILDPFAGGSVRGIVAASLGFEYLGNDLRKEQIEANRANAIEVLRDEQLYPVWTVGDSVKIDSIANGYKADMVFSCPPYADLEVYSDDIKDISNMDYVNFIKAYNEIIAKSCTMLNDDRFACFVVGEVRDKKGAYINFVADTIAAFLSCGLIYYNELILVNTIGTLPIRAGRYFSTARKIGKQHQNVLVFYKGNPKNIKNNYPELDLSYIDDIENDAPL